MASSNQTAVDRATVEDAEEILALQKLAYQSEAEIIDDYSIPPLHQTLAETMLEFERQIVLKVEHEGRIVGSVRSYLKAGTCYVGKLIVHPDYQNRGLGTRLLQAAEDQFPDAGRYELFTGQKSAKNLHIYRKAGYQVFQSRVASEKLTLLFLEKPNRSG